MQPDSTCSCVPVWDWLGRKGRVQVGPKASPCEGSEPLDPGPAGLPCPVGYGGPEHRQGQGTEFRCVCAAWSR